MSEKDLRKSLEFLKGYIKSLTDDYFDPMEVDPSPLIHELQHAVDHIIVDHCPDEE